MPKKVPASKVRGLKVVYVRIWQSDADAVTEMAAKAGLMFQAQLRQLVHEAVLARKRGGTVIA